MVDVKRKERFSQTYTHNLLTINLEAGVLSPSAGGNRDYTVYHSRLQLIISFINIPVLKINNENTRITHAMWDHLVMNWSQI